MSRSSRIRTRAPRRPRRAPRVESLEPRSLLSASGAFAGFRGAIDGPVGAPIPVHLAAADFGFAAGGRILLRFEANAASESPLDPGPTGIEGTSPFSARILTRQRDRAGGTGSVTIASLRPGSFAVRPAAERGSSGEFELRVSLAGDVNGDSRVDRDDLLAIRDAFGSRQGEAGEALDADVNGDGRVGLIDLLVAWRNLGASTGIRPLEPTLGIDPAADPDGDGRVDAGEVDLVGRAAPGGIVRVDLGADGTVDEEVTADAEGNYRVTVPLEDGPNPVAIEASDGFGQAGGARITVIRGGPASTVSASYDFSRGDEGWAAGFTDLPAEPDPIYELESGIRDLPAELGSGGTGYLLQGHNRSDDLFMYLTRRVGAAEGILPDQAYEARFTITFASNGASGSFGIGGSPGDSVYLKAGAGPVEPMPVERDGEILLNVDKGQQSVGGPAASVAGTIANGQEPVESGDQPYASVTVQHTHAVPARADSEGNLWLLVGTDSAFEGLTALYYQRIDVELVPVAS